jgi:hypothetical protein
LGESHRHQVVKIVENFHHYALRLTQQNLVVGDVKTLD